MTTKEIKKLENLAKKNKSKKEALELFIKAGILDSKGNFTTPYSSLKIFKK